MPGTSSDPSCLQKSQVFGAMDLVPWVPCGLRGLDNAEEIIVAPEENLVKKLPKILEKIRYPSEDVHIETPSRSKAAPLVGPMPGTFVTPHLDDGWFWSTQIHRNQMKI